MTSFLAVFKQPSSNCHINDLSLARIIQEKKLSVYFQPIIENNSPVIFGYEALIRGPLNSAFYSPLSLFKAASEQGRLLELELLCRELSILQFKKLNLSGKLFLNASPETLFQPNFRSGRTLAMLQKIGLDPKRVVIELTEHSPLENYEIVREALKHYKTMGFEIAMDEQESKSDGHIDEKLGWIAIQQGAGTTSEGRKIATFFDQLTQFLIEADE